MIKPKASTTNNGSPASAFPVANPTLPSPIDDGVGLANVHLNQSRRRLLDLLNKLYNTGVQADVDIPQIAVIGSQSAGKSSLIESISGITLPRAAGTCTRCPTECKLSSSSSDWTCIVTLRFTTDVNGQTLGQPRTIVFGPAITDKSNVEERIRRAQRAILNPGTSYQIFLDGDDEDLPKSELTFSTNCVTLQISGPGVADLSFCDLPGLIASVGAGGNNNDIQLVESLVTSYISKPSCVILLTVACETDFENQGAHQLAKKHDPHGKRTIGVLTKPDRIPTGEEGRWLRFIQNEIEPLENNWFCVKQPSSNDLKQGVTWANARQRENEFFSMTAPWCNLESMYQKYLRTGNLVERASSILSDLISRRLPVIQEELQKALRKTEEALAAMPKEPSADAFSEVMALLHTFATDVSFHVDGFRMAIRSTAPQFVPLEKRVTQDFTMTRPKFLDQEEGTDADATDEDSLVEHIFIDEVMARAQKARARELPDNYPFVVRAKYVSSITEKWHSPAQILCNQMYNVLFKYMKELIHKHFASFGQGNLEQRVGVILQNHIQAACHRAEERIKWLISLEARPFTLNEHYLSEYKDKFLSFYKAVRQSQRNPELLASINDHLTNPPKAAVYNRSGHVVTDAVQPNGIAKILSGLAEVGILGVKPEDIPKLLPSDTMEPAMTIMAEVRAYFQVAYKRFVDNIPLAIDQELILGLEQDILPTLYSGLGLNGPDGMRICQELTQESPQVAGKREELKKRWERLSAASRELLSIGL
ncbi:hypothetical protein PC9H_008182 [Pleurotus ostreatus]|uniref:Uncharacterized protein n=1 Tax=Pleurotus ostreatus TaxID=5322 RepID=A0A8H7DTG2_PLEOS|nr:uncharacterized protein PC9H_008182 [Pleurotus ostreatus]KAF7428945.1 hypothetical protein PC9H_008182 [Pleurotus ostreatus]